MKAVGEVRPTAAASCPAAVWILRIGLAGCFIGHGAFGIITKQAWLPYFAVGRISESVAWRLMPWIGAMDITIALLVLVWPCRILFVWASAWTLWTAWLRPLAGEGWPEFFERAGNFGVPLAIVVAVGIRGLWFARLRSEVSELIGRRRAALEMTLRATTATLLAGHAACAVVLQKTALAHHYTPLARGSEGVVMIGVGSFEFLLALVVLAIPSPGLLLFVCFWKLATEFVVFLERHGGAVVRVDRASWQLHRAVGSCLVAAGQERSSEGSSELVYLPRAGL